MFSLQFWASSLQAHTTMNVHYMPLHSGPWDFQIAQREWTLVTPFLGTYLLQWQLASDRYSIPSQKPWRCHICWKFLEGFKPEGFQRFTFQGTGKYPIQGVVSGTWVEFAFFQTYRHLVELPLWTMGEKARKKRTSLAVNALNELIVYIPISFLFDNQLISRHELGVNDWKPDYNL